MNKYKEVTYILEKISHGRTPSKLKPLASKLVMIPDAKEAVLRLMASGQYLGEAYLVLTHLKATDTVADLTTLLSSPDEQVRRMAMFTLMELDYAPKSAKLGQAVGKWLQTLPNPPQSEKDCLRTIKAAQTLIVTNQVSENLVERLQAILFFIPKGRYGEMYWPKTWLNASRLLRQLGRIDKLKEVAISQKTHYLSVVGALALAEDGFRHHNVVNWLKQERDYYLLTASEHHELRQLLNQSQEPRQKAAPFHLALSPAA